LSTDFSNYWQENKRFLSSVGGGVFLFFAGWIGIDRYLGSDLRAQRARLARLERELGEPMHSSADLEQARADNEALKQAVATLRAAAEFEPREEFRLAQGVPAANRYFAVVSSVREDLEQRAGRAGLALPADLGLPALAPTREVEIARSLEALDMVARTVELAIESGVERVSEIRIKLDPRILSGKGIHDLEKTLVEMKFVGPAQPLTRMLVSMQAPRPGGPSPGAGTGGGSGVLLVERADFAPERAKSDEVRLELALVLPHLHGVELGAAE